LVRNQKDQWLRDMRAEKERWLRDKLQEIYSNCVYYLGANFHVYIPDDLKGESKVEYHKLDFERAKLDNEYYAELQKWVNLLLVYHPFKGTPDYQAFIEKVRERKLRTADVIELASKDPRLQIDLTKAIKNNNRIE
jgi:hypothetical protein